MAVKLGNTTLEVGRISLGTVKFGRNTGVRYPGSFDLPDDSSIVRLLEVSQELGVNLLDTAPAYGSSEERIGRLLTGNRNDWIVCTKTGESFENEISRFDFSFDATIASVEQSLKRLRTDYLDIVLVHCDDNDAHIISNTGALEALQSLKDRGDIRYLGASVKTTAGGMAALPHSDVLMVTLNLEDLDSLDVINAAKETGTGILLKKVFASGHHSPEESLSFALGTSGVHSAVLGTINEDHLRENAGIAAAITAP